MHNELVDNLLRFSEQDDKIRQLLDNRQNVLQFVERSRKEIQECNDKIERLKQQGGGAATDRSSKPSQ
jgi:prefoldin subunit 5